MKISYFGIGLGVVGVVTSLLIENWIAALWAFSAAGWAFLATRNEP